MEKKLYDVSMLVTPSTIVYPGNPQVQFVEHNSSSSTHTEVTFGTHTGTHIDAPSHVFSDKPGVGIYDMENFIGECSVIDVTDAENSIKIDHIKEYIEPEMRVLFKTKNSFYDYEEFRDDYVYLDGDTADWLATMNPLVVGVDYLSIKQRGSTDNRPHTSLLERNIPIVEGLVLDEVEHGSYELMCLPIKMDDRDGAPARVILREL
jgi:arylformamidase